jgi:hypothetical protein
MIDIISLIIGFVIGVIVVGIAVEFGARKKGNDEPASRHTKNWSISEISNPKIMAEYLGDIDIPKNAKILVNKYKDQELLNGLNAKKYSKIKGNYIVGDDRALILSGPIKNDELGFWTIEKDIVENLNYEFNEMWSKAIDLKTND